MKRILFLEVLEDLGPPDLEGEVADLLVEGFIEPLGNLLDHLVELIELELLPGLLIAVGLILEEVLFNELLDHVFLPVLGLLRHRALYLPHLLDDLLLRVLPEPLDRLVELSAHVLPRRMLLQILLLGTVPRHVLAIVPAVLHVLLILLVVLLLVHLVEIMVLLLIPHLLRDHV
jgi:hypothetical protein